MSVRLRAGHCVVYSQYGVYIIQCVILFTECVSYSRDDDQWEQQPPVLTQCTRPAVSQSADHAVVITTSRQSQPIVSDNNRYNICPKHGLTLVIIVSQQYRYVTVTALKSLIICHFW